MFRAQGGFHIFAQATTDDSPCSSTHTKLVHAQSSYMASKPACCCLSGGLVFHTFSPLKVMVHLVATHTHC